MNNNSSALVVFSTIVLALLKKKAEGSNNISDIEQLLNNFGRNEIKSAEDLEHLFGYIRSGNSRTEVAHPFNGIAALSIAVLRNQEDKWSQLSNEKFWEKISRFNSLKILKIEGNGRKNPAQDAEWYEKVFSNRTEVLRMPSEFVFKSFDRWEWERGSLGERWHAIRINKQLNYLQLNRCRITNLDFLNPNHSSWLVSYPNLIVLDLSNNYIKSFYSPEDVNDHFEDGEICKQMPNLISLNLSQNPLVSLPRTGFKYLKRLESLDISWTKISALPNNIGILKKLSKINLIGASYGFHIPPSAKKLTKIKEMHTNSICPNIGYLIGLEKLVIDMTNRRFSDNLSEQPKYTANLCESLKGKVFPLSISKLVNLKVLTLSTDSEFLTLYKRINLPKIGQLTHLEELNLRFPLKLHPYKIQNMGKLYGWQDREAMIKHWGEVGTIKSFPKLDNLKKLKVLNIQSCNGLPEDIGNLVNLRKLKVLSGWRFKIQKLPTSIGNLKRLRELNLNDSLGTFVTHLPELNLIELKNLRLKHSYLTELPPSIAKSEKIKIIDLSWSSQFETLPEGFGPKNRVKSHRHYRHFQKSPDYYELRIRNTIVKKFPNSMQNSLLRSLDIRGVKNIDISNILNTPLWHVIVDRHTSIRPLSPQSMQILLANEEMSSWPKNAIYQLHLKATQFASTIRQK
jgi:Leucine-rich repeat (LRR) protein